MTQITRAVKTALVFFQRMNMLVKVKNKTNNTINLSSGPLYPFQEGFASQAEASNMFAVLEWIQDEPEKKGPGRPRKEDLTDE